MTGQMAAVVGFVIDAPFGNPPIAQMTVAPDGLVLARPAGEVSQLAIGRYSDLLVAWLGLLNAARLTAKERMEAETLFAAKVGYFHSPDA